MDAAATSTAQGLKQNFQIENATVLSREERGEGLMYIVAMSPVHGIVRMMKKISAKRCGAMPDIFDDIDAETEADSPTSLKFAREIEIVKRRTAIASRYESFEKAAQIAECAAKNGAHIEDCERFSGVLRKSLDSLAQGAPPSAVAFKFLYLFTRDEGYAVREDFYASLSEPQKILFQTVAKTPASELGEFESRTEDLLCKLREWTASNTEIIP